MADTIRTAIVIPAFNAAATVRSVVMRSKPLADDIIVVDDGSTDRTLEEVRESGVIVLHFKKNHGKGAAIAAGLTEASRLGAGVAVTLDADGQHAPASVPKLLEEFWRGPRAVILGCRANLDDPSVPGSTRTGLAISNFWIKLETGLALQDTQTGLRAYPIPEILDLDCRSRRFDWEIEVLVRAAWAGLPIRDVPVEVRYDLGRGDARRFRPFRDNLLISLTHARLVALRLAKGFKAC